MTKTRAQPKEIETWDKAKWHVDGKFPKDLSVDDACRHILFMLRWLRKKGLTTPDGDDETAGVAGDDLSITSDMVSERGRAFLNKYYGHWLKSGDVDYRKKRYTSKQLETYWNEFQKNAPVKKVKEKSGQVRLLDYLTLKAKRNEVEVEDLLRIVAKADSQAVPILRQLAMTYHWDKTMQRWVKVICLYLENGDNALDRLILDEGQSASDREMAVSVLEAVATPESVVQICEKLLPNISRNRKIAFKVVSTINFMFSFSRSPRLPSANRKRIRLLLHKYLPHAEEETEAATVYCALRRIGDSESIDLIRSRPPLKGAWKGIEGTVIKEIRKSSKA